MIRRPESIRYIAFGASVTENKPKYGVPMEDAYWALVARRLQEEFEIPVEVINAGVGGHTTIEALARIQSDVLDRKPDIVSIQFGVNDSNRPIRGMEDTPPRVAPYQFRMNLLEIVSRIRSIGASPILMTTQMLGPNAPRSRHPHTLRLGLNFETTRYSEIIRRVGAEAGVPVADLQKAFSAIPDYAKMLPDGAHPDSAGHRLIADTLYPVIAAVLRARLSHPRAI